MKYSGVSEPLKLIGGKWKIAILHTLSMGPIRFGELKRNLSPITQQMLTKQFIKMPGTGLQPCKFQLDPRAWEFCDSASQHGNTSQPVDFLSWSDTAKLRR